MSWNIVELDVIRWSEAQGIIKNSTSETQIRKAYEEMDELFQSIQSGDKKNIIDGLGNVLVCLINVAAIEDITLTNCLKHTYKKIKETA